MTLCLTDAADPSIGWKRYSAVEKNLIILKIRQIRDAGSVTLLNCPVPLEASASDNPEKLIITFQKNQSDIFPQKNSQGQRCWPSLTKRI